MPNYSDEQLVAKYLVNGDEKSLEILINRYLKPIYSFVFRYVGDGEAAEDITQEAFVKVWKNLKKFDPFLRGKQNKSSAPNRTCSGSAFKTWIFSIAKNTSIDWLKKKKAIPFSNFENEEGENLLTGILADPAPLPNEILERVGITETVNAAMTQLAPKYRMVLFLRYNDHFTFREIAQVFGEPLHTIKSRHRRALAQLKKLL